MACQGATGPTIRSLERARLREVINQERLDAIGVEQASTNKGL
jgi:hypothetical protein